MEYIYAFNVFFSAFDMISGDYLSVETLAKRYPEVFGRVFSNPVISQRAKIEGLVDLSLLVWHNSLENQHYVFIIYTGIYIQIISAESCIVYS